MEKEVKEVKEVKSHLSFNFLNFFNFFFPINKNLRMFHNIRSRNQ